MIAQYIKQVLDTDKRYLHDKNGQRILEKSSKVHVVARTANSMFSRSRRLWTTPDRSECMRINNAHCKITSACRRR